MTIAAECRVVADKIEVALQRWSGVLNLAAVRPDRANAGADRPHAAFAANP